MFPISFLISSDCNCIGSCFFPGLEDSGERRPLLEVTEEEPPGHMVIEKEQALQEGRPARQGYRDVSLTGCHQSVMPWYRLPAFFGKFEAPDERGIMRIVSAAVSRDRHSDGDTVDSLRQPWLLDKAGCVIGFQNAHGNVATAQEIQDDAEAWAVAFARDVRGVFCQNHDHNCVAACSKYAKPKDKAPDGQGAQLPRRKKLDPRDYCRLFPLRPHRGNEGPRQGQENSTSRQRVGDFCFCLQHQHQKRVWTGPSGSQASFPLEF